MQLRLEHPAAARAVLQVEELDPARGGRGRGRPPGAGAVSGACGRMGALLAEHQPAVVAAEAAAPLACAQAALVAEEEVAGAADPRARTLLALLACRDVGRLLRWGRRAPEEPPVTAAAVAAAPKGGQDSEDPVSGRGRWRLPAEARRQLEGWFQRHLSEPYPTWQEKQVEIGLRISNVSASATRRAISIPL